MSLPEHQRIIPHFDISEQGLRELEIWIKDRLGAVGSQGWRFDFDNEGGFGFLRFNTSFDLDTFPTPDDSLSQGGEWGAVFEDASGKGFLIGSTTLMKVIADGLLQLSGDSGVLMVARGDMTLRLFDPGNEFTLKDSAEDNLIQMTDGSPDLHLPTGGNIIFDQ